MLGWGVGSSAWTTYVLGMDGVSLISSYMDSKGGRDVASHPVKAVKNTQII